MVGMEMIICGIQRFWDKQWIIAGCMACIAVVVKSGMVLWFWDVLWRRGVLSVGKLISGVVRENDKFARF